MLRSFQLAAIAAIGSMRSGTPEVTSAPRPQLTPIPPRIAPRDHEEHEGWPEPTPRKLSDTELAAQAKRDRRNAKRHREMGRIDPELVFSIALAALMIILGLTSICALVIALSQGCAQ